MRRKQRPSPIVSTVGTLAPKPWPFEGFEEWLKSLRSRARRFAVCPDCLKENVTACGGDPSHKMQLLDTSPYVLGRTGGCFLP